MPPADFLGPVRRAVAAMLVLATAALAPAAADEVPTSWDEVAAPSANA